ncbi:hypothetical protein, partial [Klebsiella pneumoniae]|uniref:hypothetical protein n=1 Tax=Klebsiella pneumoniae TaxID=573 RepID=UPI0027319DD1
LCGGLFVVCWLGGGLVVWGFLVLLGVVVCGVVGWVGVGFVVVVVLVVVVWLLWLLGWWFWVGGVVVWGGGFFVVVG